MPVIFVAFVAFFFTLGKFLFPACLYFCLGIIFFVEEMECARCFPPSLCCGVLWVNCAIYFIGLVFGVRALSCEQSGDISSERFCLLLSHNFHYFLPSFPLTLLLFFSSFSILLRLCSAFLHSPPLPDLPS